MVHSNQGANLRAQIGVACLARSGRSLPTGLHRQPEPAVQPTAPTRQVTSRRIATGPNSSTAARRTATREITASQHSAYRPRNSMENQRPWRTATAASGRARWLAQVQDAWVHSNHRLANQRSPRFLSMMRRHSWHNGSGYSDDPRFVASALPTLLGPVHGPSFRAHHQGPCHQPSCRQLCLCPPIS